MGGLHQLQVDMHVIRQLATPLGLLLLIRALAAAQTLGKQLACPVLGADLHQAGVGLVQAPPTESAEAELDHDSVVQDLRQNVQLQRLVVNVTNHHEVAGLEIPAVKRVVVHLAEDGPSPLLHVSLVVHHGGQLNDPLLGWPPLPVLLLIIRRAVLSGLHHLLLHAIVLVVDRLQQTGSNAPLGLLEDLVVALEELVASKQHPEHVNTGPEPLMVLLGMQVSELQCFEELIVELLHVQANHHVGALLGAGRPRGLASLVLVVVFKNSTIGLQDGIRIIPHQADRLQHQVKSGLPFLHLHLIESCC
mmetsp:Transcript_19365/g.42855  ORF Transcript_19365/g.42855 Transcript_19365/m.42855 type:complete len:305 (+) Transcript_19365:1041-1955(+)